LEITFSTGVSCVTAAYFCHFYYTLYLRQVNLDARIDGLQQEMAQLKKERHFKPIRAKGCHINLRPRWGRLIFLNGFTGGVATLDPRLMSGNPPGCADGHSKPNVGVR
jgi:hypothetical protein